VRESLDCELPPAFLESRLAEQYRWVPSCRSDVASEDPNERALADERRVALVTGANRGIGRETVRQLIEHGFRAILSARDQERGRAAADELGAEFVRLDVADDASVDRCFQTVDERYDRLDVLINNAAIDYDTWQRGVDADLAVVQQAFETNLFGAWRCRRRAIPLMERNAWGRIVNVSSEGGSLASMGGS
jgi:NAD(P)-dependent dehydrogenase (short-subunit alcohol dehydrogenase family)